jgi:homoprotocatechuate degradation regulator HpaR
MSQFRPMLAEHGFNEQQWRVVRVLSETGAIDQTELAERASLLGPSLTRIVAALSQRGLVTQERDTADQRRRLIALTPEGETTITAILPESQEIYAKLESSIGKEKIASLLDLLEEVTKKKRF